MPKDISIKELRTNLAEYADRAERGESFRVIRRSKPSFVIMNIKEDTSSSEHEWETIVDFTDTGKSKGIAIDEVIKMLERMRD